MRNHLRSLLLQTPIETVAERSITHCHVPHVHSIVLAVGPPMVRMFVAEPGHPLAGNFRGTLYDAQSVAFHDHHCGLRLDVLTGRLLNWTVAPTASGEIHVTRYRYRSRIATGAMCFAADGPVRLATVDYRLMPYGDHIELAATDVHTTGVPADEWAAWVVTERPSVRRPDDSVCYSTADLTASTGDGLYQPMSVSDLRRLLRAVGVFTQEGLNA